MPYIALQLVGMEVVIAALGIPMTIAIPGLAARSRRAAAGRLRRAGAYTYSSGLRAPALIAVVKDVLIYITVLAAVIVIPAELGGYAQDLRQHRSQDAAAAAGAAGQSRAAVGLCHAGAGFGAGAVSLSAFGDGAAQLVQPPCHPAQCRHPAGLFLRAGPDRAAGLHGGGGGGEGDAAICRRASSSFGNNFAVPALFLHDVSRLVRGRRLRRHRHRRAGAGRDHVDRLRQSLHPQHLQGISSARTARRAREAQVAKIVSLVVKLGALFFVLELPTHYAIQLQLLGGIWIIQTAAGGAARPLHAQAPSDGAADRLGGRHRRRHLDGLAQSAFKSSTYPAAYSGRWPCPAMRR